MKTMHARMPWTFVLAVLFAGCARPAPRPAVAALPAPTRLELTLASDRTRDDRVDVTEIWTASGPETLSFTPVSEARIEQLVVADEAGPVPYRDVDGRYELEREVRGRLAVRYSVVLGRKPGASFAEPVDVHVAGSDVLVLPASDAPWHVALALRTGVLAAGGASSFGLGPDQAFTASYEELRRAWYLAGNVGTAQFHAGDGDDIAAWAGHTAFDPRWVSAETAAIRGAIDTWMGASRAADAPPTVQIIIPTQGDGPLITVAHATHGLVISVDRRAPWTASARILVAQTMARRYVGGLLAVDDGERFWSDGFSRAIARNVVFDAGTIDHAERASELNALFAVLAFGDDPDALVTARGALAATALDVALRKRGSSLQAFVRTLLAEAAKEKRRVIRYPDFVDAIRASPAGEPAAKALDAAVAHIGDSELPPDLLGRCYRLERRQLVPFELGFTTSAGQELAVVTTKHGSHAEAAGLVVGDVVRDLQYTAGRADVPVTMTLVRGDRARAVRFLPAGIPKPGRAFERVPGISDDRC